MIKAAVRQRRFFIYHLNMTDLFADDLFANDKFEPQEFLPHRRLCLYCYQYFETHSKFLNKCPAHKDMPDRKIITNPNQNALPF